MSATNTGPTFITGIEGNIHYAKHNAIFVILGYAGFYKDSLADRQKSHACDVHFIDYCINTCMHIFAILTAVGSSLARATCETSQVLLAGGQVVFLGDLPFSPCLTIDMAQNE